MRYRQISPANFDQRLIEALANNQSPDMLILSQADIRRHQNKILQIPFDSFPASTYYRSYIDSAAYLANENGIFAVPITVDPMMLYYNRDHFKQAGLINPPADVERAPQLRFGFKCDGWLYRPRALEYRAWYVY